MVSLTLYFPRSLILVLLLLDLLQTQFYSYKVSERVGKAIS